MIGVEFGVVSCVFGKVALCTSEQYLAALKMCLPVGPDVYLVNEDTGLRQRKRKAECAIAERV